MVLTTVDIIGAYGLMVPLAAAPFFVVQFWRFRRYCLNRSTPVVRAPRALSWFMIFSLLIFCISNSIMSQHERSRVRLFLKGPMQDTTVFVNGLAFDHADQVLAALENLVPLSMNHTRVVQTLHLEIHSSGGELRLNLGRDSGDKHNYWVFSPLFRSTSEHEIGRITTSVLDDVPNK